MQRILIVQELHEIIPMAEMKLEMGVALVVMSMLCRGGVAQESSCTSELVKLSPCLSYVAGNSSNPSSGCCSQLATVVRSQPLCLCQVLNGGGGSSLGLTINQNQALALPGACNVHTPPVTQCNNAVSPAEAPISKPSGTGSSNVPNTDNRSSSANSVKLSIPLLFTVLAATFAPIFGALIL